MRVLVLFLGLYCANAASQLPPKVEELLKPYLNGPLKDILLQNLLSEPFRTTTYKQERALHLLLDGIVREVNANLQAVDVAFEKQKQAVRDVRNARYRQLEAETQKQIDEQARLETSLSDAERNKINADNAYDASLGQSKMAKLRVVKLKESERTGKIAANELFNQRYLEIDAEHNESRQQYVDELMFVAKLRQMIEQLNVEYKHHLGEGKTSSPTVSPTPAPTQPTPSPTRFPTPSPTLMNNLDGTNGWKLVAQEAGHHAGLLSDLGRFFGYFNSPSFNLGPTYKFGRDYTEVAMTWGGPQNFARFISSQDFFDSKVNLNMAVYHVETSEHEDSYVGGAGLFCRAAVEDGSRRSAPGETSWGLLPTDNSQRKCGCSSGTEGSGIYYGGTASDCTSCECHGGGFTGFVANGGAKYDVNLGKQLQIWVRKGNWRVLSGCESPEDGSSVTKASAATPGRFTATAVSSIPVLSVTASATSTEAHSQVGLTLLQIGGVNRRGQISPNWGIEFGPGGLATLFGLGGTIPTDNLDKFKDVVLGEKLLHYTIGSTARVALEDGKINGYINGEKVHTYIAADINLLNEDTWAQFSFIENGASVDKISLEKLGYWTGFEKKCQGNNNDCALKTHEECASQCSGSRSCTMYMYNKVTGGCCMESCFPPDYVPASPMPEIPVCDAWMNDCSQDGGWDSFVKEYPKA